MRRWRRQVSPLLTKIELPTSGSRAPTIRSFLGWTRSGDRQRLRRTGRGRSARRARLPRDRSGEARRARRPRPRAPAGRLHLRRRSDHRHRAVPVRGALAALRRELARRRRRCARCSRSIGSASTTARSSITAATRRRCGAEVARFSPGDVAGYERFMATASASSTRLRATSAHVPFDRGPTWRGSLPQMLRLQGYRSVYRWSPATSGTSGCAWCSASIRC